MATNSDFSDNVIPQFIQDLFIRLNLSSSIIDQFRHNIFHTFKSFSSEIPEIASAILCFTLTESNHPFDISLLNNYLLDSNISFNFSYFNSVLSKLTSNLGLLTSNQLQLGNHSIDRYLLILDDIHRFSQKFSSFTIHHSRHIINRFGGDGDRLSFNRTTSNTNIYFGYLKIGSISHKDHCNRIHLLKTILASAIVKNIIPSDPFKESS